MKRLTLLLLLLISTNIMAEWTEVSSDDDGMTAYVDFGTIKKKGHKVKMWELFDYKTVINVMNIRFLSSVSLDEYDCEEVTKKGIGLYHYSGNMRTGVNIYSLEDNQEKPHQIIPGSISEVTFKIACGKK